MPPQPIRVRLSVLHAAFDARRREAFARLREALLDECRGFEDRIDLHFYEETTARGSLPAWLKIMRDGVARAWDPENIESVWTDALNELSEFPHAYFNVTKETIAWAESLGRFRPTHLAFLPDDVTLGRGYAKGLLRMIEARPDDVICGLTNHAEAARMRAAGARWYTTRDAWNGFGVVTARFAAEHLLWRRRELLADREGQRSVQHDEGVSLHLMSLGRAIYKPLPGLVQHEDETESLDGSFVAGDGSDKIRRRSVSFEPDTDLGEIAWEDGDTLDVGRSYSGTHWSLVYDLERLSPTVIETAYSCERDRGYFEPARLASSGGGLEDMPKAVISHQGQTRPGVLTREDVSSARERTEHGVDVEPHVWISVPEYQPALPAQRVSLEKAARALRRAGVRVTTDLVVGQSLVTRARNWGCVHAFMRSRANVLFQWDGDVECLDEEAIVKMLRTGHPVLAGAYPFRDGSGKPCATLPCSPTDPNAPLARQYHVEEDGTCLAHEVATGFLLVRRVVITDLMSRHPELVHEQDGGPHCGAPAWALFDTRLEELGRGRRRRYLSEDWEFSRLCREAGWPVRLFLPPTFRHWGITPCDGHVEIAWGDKTWEEIYGPDPAAALKGKATRAPKG
jgi:hypothetical protein